MLALRNVFHDRLRFGLSVASVALSIMLVVVLNGLLNGMYRQVSAYLEQTPGSLVVAQAGVGNLLGATSVLPPQTVAAARSTEGVERVIPILSQFVILELHGKKQPLYLVGYQPELGGGPWRFAAGNPPAATGDIVLDRVLAKRHGLRVGETITVMGQPFTISGLSHGTTSWMTSFAFARKDAAEALLRAPGATSFLLVTPAPGYAAGAVAERLAALPGIEVVPKDRMIANDLRLLVRYFSAPLQLMVGIALLVGALVVGLVIFTATVERQREYGVLKAIGARPRRLYGVVAAQAMVTATAGSLAGVALAVVASRVIEAQRPQFLVDVAPGTIVWVLGGAFGMALLAALAPARLVASLPPAEVFRRAS